MPSPTAAQRDLCARFNVVPQPALPESRLGAALNLKDSTLWPVNGLRHAPIDGTNGWYLWAGEALSDADDFFEPLHLAHLSAWRPEAAPYLALPPGWRFLIAPGHEEVWHDASLLDV